LELIPQATTVPSVRNAKVCAAAAWVAIAVMPLKPAGNGSAPVKFVPQRTTVPSAFSATLPRSFAATAITRPISPGGVACPRELSPHPTSVPSLFNARAW
jgi:hypothetical protein